MKRLQGFILGIFVALIVVASIPNFADTVSVLFNTINLRINDVQVAKQGDMFVLDNGETVPFSIIYKGTTYLPLRKVGQLLGKNVLWDGTTKTISVNDYIATTPTTPTAAVVPETMGTLKNPIPSSNDYEIKFQKYSWESQKTVKISVAEVLRGDEALSLVKQMNPYNDSPNNDQEWVLITFNLEYVSGNDVLEASDILYIDDLFFSNGSAAVSSDTATLGGSYANFGVFDVELYAGGSSKVVLGSLIQKNSLGLYLNVPNLSDVTWIKIY